MKTRQFLAPAFAVATIATAVLPIHAATIFQEAFSGSTVGAATPAPPTANSTDYAVLSSKNSTASSIGSSLFLNMVATTSGFAQIQALFTSSPVTLAAGDFINLQMTFKPTNLLTLASSTTLNVGLYNSGGFTPVPGNAMANSGMGAGTTFNSGFAENWQGYVGRAGLASNQTIFTRDAQDAVLDGTNEVQDVLFSNAGTGAFDQPSGTTVGTGSQTISAFTNGNSYTITLNIANSGTDVTITHTIHEGVGTGGTNLYSASGSQAGGYATFDALAFGYRSADNVDPNFEVTGLGITTGVLVPEAGSVLLGSLGLFALLRRRR